MAMILKPKRCRKNSSSSIEDLTDELLVEILLRVHCKSVFRCKSVSKRWFALISDPYFTHSFLRYHTNEEKLQQREFVVNFFLEKLLIIYQHPEVSFPLSLSLGFLPCFQTSQLRKKTSVVGSSNGLILCCYTSDYQPIYYVCNPLTKHWVVLPPPISLDCHISIGFICYPLYDESQCSFKVVCLTEFLKRKSVLKGETFSSETGQWKKLKLSFPQGFDMDDMYVSRQAIAHNGMLHWVLRFDKKIVVYDPANDKVHTIIDGPEGVHPNLKLGCLGFWFGRMRIAQLRPIIHNSDRYYGLKVWELKDDATGKWRLKHRINIKKLTWIGNISPLLSGSKSTIMYLMFKARLLAFHPYEDVMYLKFKDNVVSCDLQTKTLKFAGKFPYKSKDVYTLVLPPWPTPVPALPMNLF